MLIALPSRAFTHLCLRYRLLSYRYARSAQVELQAQNIQCSANDFNLLNNKYQV